MMMKRFGLLLLSLLSLSFLTSICFASEDNKDIAPILQLEPIEVVLLCPAGSQHEGELIPNWVANDEAAEFFCNDAEEKEIAE
jgi:hypothetical protein